MGNSASVGLLIGLGINADEAKAALKEFEGAGGRSFGGVAGHTGELNKSILNAHHSTHLLLEDFHTHLPRAVLDAVAEALPGIAALGGGLLAIFAVEEIPHLIEGIKNLANSWDGFGEAEKAAMEKAIQDTATLHGKVIDLEKELALFGKNEAEQAAMRAKWAGEDSDRALKSLVAAEGKVRAINAEIAEAKRGAGAFAAGAGSAYEGALTGARAEVGKLREAWKVADEGALLAQRRAAEASAKLTKQQTADEEKAAREAEERARRVAATQSHFAMQRIHTMQEAGKVADQLAARSVVVENTQTQALVMAMGVYEDLFAKETFMDAGMKALLPDMSQFTEVTVQGNHALMEFNKAMASSTVAAGKQLAVGLAGLVAGRRAKLE